MAYKTTYAVNTFLEKRNYLLSIYLSIYRETKTLEGNTQGL